jgi:hypothetical protein
MKIQNIVCHLDQVQVSLAPYCNARQWYSHQSSERSLNHLFILWYNTKCYHTCAYWYFWLESEQKRKATYYLALKTLFRLQTLITVESLKHKIYITITI